jgi:hypothetical protein
VLLLLPTSIGLLEVGADFPFPRGAALQSDDCEQAQLLAACGACKRRRAVAIARLAKQDSAVDGILE